LGGPTRAQQDKLSVLSVFSVVRTEPKSSRQTSRAQQDKLSVLSVLSVFSVVRTEPKSSRQTSRGKQDLRGETSLQELATDLSSQGVDGRNKREMLV